MLYRFSLQYSPFPTDFSLRFNGTFFSVIYVFVFSIRYKFFSVIYKCVYISLIYYVFDNVSTVLLKHTKLLKYFYFNILCLLMKNLKILIHFLLRFLLRKWNRRRHFWSNIILYAEVNTQKKWLPAGGNLQVWKKYCCWYFKL